MKRLIICMLTIIIIISAFGCSHQQIPSLAPTIDSHPTTSATTTITTPSTVITTEPEITIPTFNFEWQIFEYIKFNNLDDLLNERLKLEQYTLEFTIACTNYMLELPLENANQMVTDAWDFYNTTLVAEQTRLLALIEQYEWDYRYLEYPTATEVWLFLTNEMGYNNYVAAGIIGNMMAECGGQTLKLKWNVYNSAGYYGLCQWSPKYYPEMQGASLEEQLAFLKESLPRTINRYGSIWYKEGFTHDDFIAIVDAEEAANAFCLLYERPGPGSYEKRKANALKALEYFMTTITIEALNDE